MLDSVQTWLTPCSPVDAGLPALNAPASSARELAARWASSAATCLYSASGRATWVAAVTARVTTPPRPCMLGVVRHYVSQRGARIVGTEMSRRAMGTDTALNSPANADCPLVPRFDSTLSNELSNYRLAARRSGSVNLAWPHAGRGSWTRVDLAPEMFGALVHDGGLVWSSGVPGSLVGVLVVDR